MFLPPFFVLCHAPYPFLPCGLVDLHSVFTALVRSTALLRRPGVTSPACIISGDGYSIVKVQSPDKQSFSH